MILRVTHICYPARPCFSKCPAALRKLLRDCEGATLVEFAMIAPVLLMLLMGMFDMSYNVYTKIQLQGRIQNAARDSTIEGAKINSAIIDDAVRDAVQDVAPGATVSFARASYTNFSDIRSPEDWTDVTPDGVCADGEPFEDVNGNGTWDTDRGTNGMGGARDAVLYTVTVSYPRAFPIASLIGLPDRFTTDARTVLRNQPFAMQDTAPTVAYCP